MTLDFDRIRMPNGSTYDFAGVLQSVMANDEAIRVDNVGTLEEESRTSTTLQRTAIGTAVGALIGAIVGGGKGAAIGGAVRAGAGAGSVYVQGRDDLELARGTEVTILASAP
jgi:outer membrane lipoprotein SlyB